MCKGHVMGPTAAIDHIQRKEDGGMGLPNNGQLTHPYCNSVIKQ
ncbi:HNH endonuclease [Myxococcus dinghuensis]